MNLYDCINFASIVLDNGINRQQWNFYQAWHSPRSYCKTNLLDHASHIHASFTFFFLALWIILQGFDVVIPIPWIILAFPESKVVNTKDNFNQSQLLAKSRDKQWLFAKVHFDLILCRQCVYVWHCSFPKLIIICNSDSAVSSFFFETVVLLFYKFPVNKK